MLPPAAPDVCAVGDSAALSHVALPLLLARLPPDDRLRAAAVCRAWRAAAADPHMWTHLTLPSNIAVRASNGFLLAAAARAAPLGLIELDSRSFPELAHATLAAVVAAHGATLRTLRCATQWREPSKRAQPALQPDEGSFEQLAALLASAPGLTHFHAHSVICADAALTARLLRREPPFGALHMLQLNAICSGSGAAAEERVHTLIAALAGGHGSLRELVLCCLDLRFGGGALDALVDALRDALPALNALSFVAFHFPHSATTAPALARLLGADCALRSLSIDAGVLDEHTAPLLNAAGAGVLAAALALSKNIDSLTIKHTGLWRVPAAAAALLHGLTGHASLRRLTLHFNGGLPDEEDEEGGAGVVGAALGALLSADAPALCHLDLSHSARGEGVLTPLAHALAANTRLRTLSLIACGASEAFARDALAPALHANAGLRSLSLNEGTLAAPAAHAAVLHELTAFVQQRTMAHVAALLQLQAAAA
jgi:hypothetical protein